MARTAHGTELDARAIGGGGDGGYARYREAHGAMPELPPGQRGKICRSRNDRGGASGSVFRAGFVFRGDAAALEGSRRAGGNDRQRSVVRRARADHGTGGRAARVNGASGGAHEGEKLAGVFRNAVLHLPSQPNAAGTELASGARLSGAAAGRPAVERGALCGISRRGAGAGLDAGSPVGQSGDASDGADERAESGPRGGGDGGGERVAHGGSGGGERAGRGVRSGSDVAAAAEDLRRCGRNFRRGRAIGGAGGDGDPVAFRGLRPRREIGELGRHPYGDQRAVSAAPDPFFLRSAEFFSTDAAGECPPEVNRAAI